MLTELAMDDGALTPKAAVAIRRAAAELGRTARGVPFADLVALAEGVEGRPLRLDLASAALIGTPMLVLREAAGREVLPLLSQRERQVAVLVARGCTNRMIAAELGISFSTVKDHVHHALTKCGMASRAELAAAVARRGP
jgi:non-specific serine/threonine protein kinase